MSIEPVGRPAERIHQSLVYNRHGLVCRLHLIKFVDMWGLRASLGGILRTGLSEIEFESHFSSFRYYPLSKL